MLFPLPRTRPQFSRSYDVHALRPRSRETVLLRQPSLFFVSSPSLHREMSIYVDQNSLCDLGDDGNFKSERGRRFRGRPLLSTEYTLYSYSNMGQSAPYSVQRRLLQYSSYCGERRTEHTEDNKTRPHYRGLYSVRRTVRAVHINDQLMDGLWVAYAYEQLFQSARPSWPVAVQTEMRHTGRQEQKSALHLAVSNVFMTRDAVCPTTSITSTTHNPQSPTDIKPTCADAVGPHKVQLGARMHFALF